ncbi:hypothetical protein K493DRAFT_321347 [Basidiobolus meristosporus CBS 931.73]|uniref:Uncharacterized protein n=1 Tax=Basidiobolus meristosporus CBS 931.73 TaxID=1314790 RepID=A0A1Y1WVM7_9FUNG|nr:hypothetical protein K493DRAFT_321347 [Basidiobolus meristosporus CBS 931.73]|eukprot:ORX77609.1 hypothetical protein K493DRAFT_321347 [Basidiobolus meristosporus CBS 931.73]
MRASGILTKVAFAICVVGTMAQALGDSGATEAELMGKQDTIIGRPNQNIQLPNKDTNLIMMIKNELSHGNVLPKEHAKQEGLVQEILHMVKKKHPKDVSGEQESHKLAIQKITQELIMLNKQKKVVEKRQAKQVPPESVLKAKITAALTRRNLLPKDSAKADTLIQEAFSALQRILGKGDAKKDDAKKDDAKKDDAKKDDAKKDDAKKDDAKKDDAKKDDAKKDDAKKDDAKKDDAKKDDAKKDDAKKDDAKKDDAKKDDAKKDDAKKDDAKKDDAKKDDAKKDDAKKDDAKKDDTSAFQRLTDSFREFFDRENPRAVEKREAKADSPLKDATKKEDPAKGDTKQESKSDDKKGHPKGGPFHAIREGIRGFFNRGRTME